MPTRKANSRTTDKALIKRDADWFQQARAWIRAKVESLLQEGTPDATVADLMAQLDRMPDLPPGYIRIIDSKTYPKRYQMVRGVLDEMRRDGFLETGTAVNAKGREDVTCYRRARPVAFQVLAEGSAADPVKSMVQQWLEANGRALTGLDSLLVTRVPVASGGVTNALQTTAKQREVKAS